MRLKLASIFLLASIVTALAQQPTPRQIATQLDTEINLIARQSQNFIDGLVAQIEALQKENADLKDAAAKATQPTEQPKPKK
jgi:hypothetical protein